jgi:hypothetical protein
MTQPQFSSHDDDIQIDTALAAALNRWSAPVSDEAERRAVLAALHAESERQVPAAQTQRNWSLRWSAMILRAQFRVIHSGVWIGSALVLTLGVVVTLLLSQPAHALTQLPIVLLAPVVAGVGAAFIYGEGIDPPLELQQAAPIRSGHVLLARLTLLFGFNLAITAAGSVLLAVFNSEISLLPLISTWLAPMSFLCALAFMLSAIWFDARLSVGVVMAIWVLNIWRHFSAAQGLTSVFDAAPDLLAAETRTLLFVSAVAFVAVGLWLAEREERHLRT